MFRRFWRFIFSADFMFPAGMVLLVVGILGTLFYGAATESTRACDHAKQFSKHEIRSDSYGCYIKGDDGKWTVIKDPAHFLE